MNRLKTAILGCGQFAHVHAKILKDLHEDVILSAFCDRNLDKAQAYANTYTDGKAMVFTDYETMFDKAGLDLVVICLPPYGHQDEVTIAAQQKVHILMEKPIALESSQAWKMVDDTEKAGIKTQVGFMFRFGSAVEYLKKAIADGQAGPTALISARYFCNALHANWWREREKSGGQLVEQVIHMFDLLRFLGGDVKTVYSKQENLFHKDVNNYSIEDVSATVLQFQSGGLGVVYATNNAIPGRWINDYRVVTKKHHGRIYQC